MVNDFNNPEENKALLYDLRQIYAIDVVGVWLKFINEACASDDFPAWFKGLKNLATKVDKNLKRPEREKIKIRYEKALKTIKEYEQAFIGQSNDAGERANIEESLRLLEKSVMRAMRKNGMFGKDKTVEGL